jgi:hypothetical protein
MNDKIRYIRNMQVIRDDGEKKDLAIKARGIAELKIRINPVLIPRKNDTVPEDGIYELDFALEEGEGVSTAVDLEVVVLISVSNLPSWVKGVKINALENSDIELI